MADQSSTFAEIVAPEDNMLPHEYPRRAVGVLILQSLSPGIVGHNFEPQESLAL